MKKIIFISCFVISFLSKAQEDSLSVKLDSIIVDSSQIQQVQTKKNPIWKNLKYDASNMAGGFLNAYTQPTRWQKDDYIKLGATAAGITLLYFVDEEINNYFHKQEPDVPGVIKDFGWYFGSPQNNYGITGAVYLFGLFTNNENIRQTGVLMITSASAAGLIQQVSKSLAGRARPNSGLGHDHFKPLGGSAEYRSFPSGHTVLSVTTMYALSKQFENPWVKAGFWTVGMIAPVSRLWEGAHWFTDIALSTALSVAIVEGVDNYLKRNQKYNYSEFKSKKQINWKLVAGPSQFGIIGVF
ncbi:phosphatase PAP2 family protein [Moheibacter sediminis]|uniref:Membrane-associated phospholipid phosphatase n=1 Tax=Moheibacter sediminis TaxID=1434700 RepID=A0A1W2BCY1_9FLAO|nr:phosphatase PAP2 family protein [Moheibacter sediminis]SMC70766.1 Membrane-associated phospholipid phosphatase [Moheibacter sediminis]